MASLNPTLTPIAAVGAPPARSRAVGVWLFGVAALVGSMIVVGGSTRLTGSGLSITEWDLIVGVLPPLSPGDWAQAFAKYRQSSQYHLINQDISLDSFKVLFWWEWSHRLLGRLLGVSFAGPFLAFLLARKIPARLVLRCWGLLALGGLQGLVGWWMVRSGLEGRASVAPERLAAHLGLALLLLTALVWTGLEAWTGEGRATRRAGAWPLATGLLAAGVYLQCLMGALVAGNKAGLIDGDWPLMAGRLWPEGYWRGGAWSTFAHGLVAVQFDHRLLAYALVIAIAALVWRAVRSTTVALTVRWLALGIGVATLCQAALGVAALWWRVPLAIALAHQANAALLLSLCVALAWRVRRLQSMVP